MGTHQSQPRSTTGQPSKLTAVLAAAVCVMTGAVVPAHAAAAGTAILIQLANVMAYQDNPVDPARTTAAPSRVLRFDGTAGTLPSPSEWNVETGGNGWGNGELQTYTNRASNLHVDSNGNLNIVVRKETYTGPDGYTRAFTSAKINTSGRVDVAAGSYTETTITAPTGSGLWPAFWTLGTNLSVVGWPASGELDILEGTGSTPTVAQSAVHLPNANQPHVDSAYTWSEPGGTTVLTQPLDRQAHTYGVYFDARMVRFYIDRRPTMTIYASDAIATGRAWPFGKSQYLILNVAISPGYDTTGVTFPKTMTIGPVSIWSQGTPF